MQRLLVVGFALFYAACGSSTGPATRQFDGTWAGEYTNSTSPQPFTATLHLTQDGQSLTGSLATSAGRTATLAGTVTADTLEATLTYTDTCKGTVTTRAVLNDEALPNELEGTYSSSDCVGTTQGTYRLLEQP